MILKSAAAELKNQYAEINHTIETFDTRFQETGNEEDSRSLIQWKNIRVEFVRQYGAYLLTSEGE